MTEFIGESYPGIFMAAFWPLMPLSRGYIHINTTNPFAIPVITPRLLTDSFDQKVAVAVARKSRDAFTSTPFQPYVADAYLDPSDIGPDGTDQQYLDWFKRTSFGASHWIGSTSMMPREWGGVVDPRLRCVSPRDLGLKDY